jgi:hypothetical protein
VRRVVPELDLDGQKQCNSSTMMRKIGARNLELEKEVSDLEARSCDSENED